MREGENALERGTPNRGPRSCTNFDLRAVPPDEAAFEARNVIWVERQRPGKQSPRYDGTWTLKPALGAAVKCSHFKKTA